MKKAFAAACGFHTLCLRLWQKSKPMMRNLTLSQTKPSIPGIICLKYPCGGKNCDDRVADIIKNNTIIKYARTVDTTLGFEPYGDFHQYKGTLYHNAQWDKLFDMGEKFLELKADTPKIFYIWGHAYEFDIYPERWKKFEEFLEMMSNRSDIFYGTNIEVFKHLL